MSKLEKQISKHILKYGLFHSMVKYKKDYQQLNVIFQRVYGKRYSDYRKEQGLENPPINLDWQQKAKLVCESFNQQIVEYSNENRVNHPVVMKCLNCERTYEITWDALNMGFICSCAKSFQRTVVDVDYYIGQYLKNGWELLNFDQYKNSHSVLKLRHKCGHITEQKCKILRMRKGVCQCERQMSAQHKKPPLITKAYTPQVLLELKMLGVTDGQLKTLRKRIRDVNGKATGISGEQLIVSTAQGYIVLDIFPIRRPVVIQKLFDYGLSQNKVKGIKIYARKHNITLLDFVDGNIIEKLECGCICTRSIKDHAPLKHLCPHKSHEKFFLDLAQYPLQSSFNERWSLIEYKGKTQPITIECKKCHHIKTLKNIYKFYYHQRCTCEDNISYGERMIFNLLNHNGVKFETQHLLDGKRFDFLLPEYNLLVEYDGIQHTMDTPWWGLTHEDQVRNDNLKNKIAKKYNYNILRFSHECGIDDIIKGFNSYVKLNKRRDFDYNKPVTLLPEEVIDDYVTMTFNELTEKYKGRGFALSLKRLNREFKMKYGVTKTEYKSLPDEVLEDYKLMNVHALRTKYPEMAEVITNCKLNNDFKKKFGMTKLQFRRQPLSDEILEDYKTMTLRELKQKYPHLKATLTQMKVGTDFKEKYGLTKQEYKNTISRGTK